MNNIAEIKGPRKTELPLIPWSPDWGPIPMESDMSNEPEFLPLRAETFSDTPMGSMDHVVYGAKEICAIAMGSNRQAGEYMIAAANLLPELHGYLTRVIRGDSSLQECADTLTRLEAILNAAGGAY